MNAGQAKVRRKRTKQRKASGQIKDGVTAELGRLHKTNSLMVVSAGLDTVDRELLLFALGLLERATQDVSAKNGCNNANQAALMHMWSRLLIVRGKLQAMEIAQ